MIHDRYSRDSDPSLWMQPTSPLFPAMLLTSLEKTTLKVTFHASIMQKMTLITNQKTDLLGEVTALKKISYIQNLHFREKTIAYMIKKNTTI